MAQCYRCKAVLTDSVFCGSCGTQVRCSVTDCDRVFEGAASQRAHLIDCHPETARANSVSTKALTTLKRHATTVSGKVAAATQAVIEQVGPALTQPPKKDLLIIAGVLGAPLALICLLFMGVISVVIFSRCTDPQRQFYGEWEANDGQGVVNIVFFRSRTARVTFTYGDGPKQLVFDWAPNGENSLMMTDTSGKGIHIPIVYNPKTDTTMFSYGGLQQELERK